VDFNPKSCSTASLKKNYSTNSQKKITTYCNKKVSFFTNIMLFLKKIFTPRKVFCIFIVAIFTTFIKFILLNYFGLISNSVVFLFPTSLGALLSGLIAHEFFGVYFMSDNGEVNWKEFLNLSPSPAPNTPGPSGTQPSSSAVVGETASNTPPQGPAPQGPVLQQGGDAQVQAAVLEILAERKSLVQYSDRRAQGWAADNTLKYRRVYCDGKPLPKAYHASLTNNDRAIWVREMAHAYSLPNSDQTVADPEQIGAIGYNRDLGAESHQPYASRIADILENQSPAFRRSHVYNLHYNNEGIPSMDYNAVKFLAEFIDHKKPSFHYTITSKACSKEIIKGLRKA